MSTDTQVELQKKPFPLTNLISRMEADDTLQFDLVCQPMYIGRGLLQFNKVNI
jgi:hypothetical protein